MRFIDLFAGLGGFHIALHDLGHKCVFASEINEDLRILYKKNFGVNCVGDINAIKVPKIPKHDIICAGFPCQPFSKAGNQSGLDDPENGNLFDRIMDIANYHTPKYIFLENVPNLKSHDSGRTWAYIHKRLSVRYDVKEKVISPHIFGVPQHRSRIYIVCKLKTKGGLAEFEFPQGNFSKVTSIESILERNPKEYTAIKKDTLHQINVWQDFLDHLTSSEAPGFPIWAMEFGATYPFEGKAPINLSAAQLKKYRGKFGTKINGKSFDEIIECLPVYAQVDQKEFPNWKKQYIKANREFYKRHKKWLDLWIPKIAKFENSHQKLEWNCGNRIPLKIDDKIVQFRPSGLRVKLPNFSPALVLPSTQIPIFPWLGRYMTRHEAARLQCMDELKAFPNTTAKTFRALGNAVNVCVVKQIASKLFS